MTTGKPAATGCDHPTYPGYDEELGEDPARILYHMDPRPHISGITDTELVRAYLDVETDRDEPRREVIAACNRQLDELARAHRFGPALLGVSPRRGSGPVTQGPPSRRVTPARKIRPRYDRSPKATKR